MRGRYRVTKFFIDGPLKGLTYVEYWMVARVDVGFVCRNPIGGSAYQIIKMEFVY